MAGTNRHPVVIVKSLPKRTACHRGRIVGTPSDLARPTQVGCITRAIRLLIVDHQELVRIGLRAMLVGESGLSIRGEASTLAEAVAETRRMRPDLLLLDYHLSGGSGAKACRLLCNAHPGIRILMMTRDKGAGVFHNAAHTGIHGVVCKDLGRAELLQAIRRVAGGDTNLDSMASQSSRSLCRDGPRINRSGLDLLSTQERRILPLLAEGKTNREIAIELVLAEPTIKNYVAKLFKKLNISRRAQAVALYLQANQWALVMN